MTGNVLELCWDWYGDITSGTVATGAPSNSSKYRIMCGGEWNMPDSGCTVSNRYVVYPYGKDSEEGFRVVRTIQ